MVTNYFHFNFLAFSVVSIIFYSLFTFLPNVRVKGGINLGTIASVSLTRHLGFVM